MEGGKREYYKRTLLGSLLVIVAIAGLIYLATKSPVEAESSPTQQIDRTENAKLVLAGKEILFVIAPKNFRDEELLIPKTYFESLGAKTTVVSTTTDTAIGMLGTRVKPDGLISRVKGSDYDCVVFVGGAGAPVLWDNPDAQRVAREAYEAGKVVGAICLAPVILARAGLLKNCNATVFHTAAAQLEREGARYTGNPVERCGRIVTANGPTAAKEFASTLKELIIQAAKGDGK